jgi:Tol biopolymer transport system component
MLKAITPRWAVLVASVVFLFSTVFATAGSAGAEAVADLNPEPPRLAYLTETATSTPKVWVAAANGGDPKLLGPGQQPLLAPNGQSVAVSLFGTASGLQEHGPALGIYPSSGAAISDYLSLETATATALAWSPDSRYLAVYSESNQTAGIAAASSLAVIDTQTGTVTTVAHGAIYGASFARDGSDRLVYAMAHSLSQSALTNLYVSEADGAGVHRVTSDGHSLDPVWGPTYIAYDRWRRRHLSPEYQIWLATPAGARVRKLTHIAVGPLVQGLVPLAFSADGSRLVAEFEGEDTSNAYAVNVASGQARAVTVRGQSAQAAGISSDGSTLLLDAGSFEQPSSHGQIVTVPFAGGHATVLVAHASQASWNR